MRARTDWKLNPSVMLANALTAFVLNLVRARRVDAVLIIRACGGEHHWGRRLPSRRRVALRRCTRRAVSRAQPQRVLMPGMETSSSRWHVRLTRPTTAAPLLRRRCSC